MRDESSFVVNECDMVRRRRVSWSTLGYKGLKECKEFVLRGSSPVPSPHPKKECIPTQGMPSFLANPSAESPPRWQTPERGLLAGNPSAESPRWQTAQRSLLSGKLLSVISSWMTKASAESPRWQTAQQSLLSGKPLSVISSWMTNPSA